MNNTLSIKEKRIGTLSREKTQGKTSRLAYIDNIRIILTALVIIFHTAISYGAFGDWTYVDPRANDMMTSVILTFFIIDCQSFFMGLFFFLAGYFTPGSYDRKGILLFWKDRLLHIGLPMLVYVFFLSRVPNYIDAYGNESLTLTFWEFSKNTFISEADQGPTWFLFVLLIFALAYTVMRFVFTKVLHIELKKLNQLPVPRTPALLGFGLFIAACMFVIAQFLGIAETYQVIGLFNLLLVFFPSYILLFFFGVVAYRNDWLTKMPGKLLKFWGPMSILLIIAFPVFMFSTGALDFGLDPYLKGMNWRCAVTCLWFGLACVSFSITLILNAREKLDYSMRLPLFKGKNTFGAYLIHPLVIVPLAYLLSPSDYNPMLKFLLVSISGVILSFFIAEVLRRIPIIKNIM